MLKTMHAGENPSVTVILLCYNHQKYIRQALSAFEKQSFKDFELIIVDDCSTDGSLGEINQWSDQTEISHTIIVNAVNQGITRNINLALAASRGEYICTMGGDDWPNPDYLDVMHHELSTNKVQPAFVFANVTPVDEAGSKLPNFPQTQREGLSPDALCPPKLFESLLVANMVDAPAAMARKDAIAHVGGYDESLSFEDYDMWLKLSFEFCAAYVDQQLVNYRIHQQSFSRNPNKAITRQVGEAVILMKWIDIAPQANRDIANHLRTISVNLVVLNEYGYSLKYLSIANSISPDWRWNTLSFCLRFPIISRILRLLLATR